jgi:hypothetical protein
MGNRFIKYFFVILLMYIWWKTDSNWKLTIYHTFMIVIKILLFNDNLNIKVQAHLETSCIYVKYKPHRHRTKPTLSADWSESQSCRESTHVHVSTTALSADTKLFNRQATYYHVATTSFGECHWCMNLMLWQQVFGTVTRILVGVFKLQLRNRMTHNPSRKG